MLACQFDAIWSALKTFLSSAFVTGLVIPVSVSILSSLFVARLTVRSERRKLVGELQRNTYMQTLEVLSKIVDNPTIIFEKDYFSELSNLRLPLEVYAAKEINEKFQKLYEEIHRKHSAYLEAFYSEAVFEEREHLRSMLEFSGELLDREEDDYKIEHMQEVGAVLELVKDLKESITHILRKG